MTPATLPRFHTTPRDVPAVAAMNIVCDRLTKAAATARTAVAVMAHGRAYTGIVRPKGFRHQRTRGACFKNAATAALRDKGVYVEGFACRIDRDLPGSFPIHHAWISVDGQSAVDQTWLDPEQCSYFGIAFPNALLARAVTLRGWWGMLSEPFILENLPHLLEPKWLAARAGG